jgi:hypothetical protein
MAPQEKAHSPKTLRIPKKMMTVALATTALATARKAKLRPMAPKRLLRTSRTTPTGVLATSTRAMRTLPLERALKGKRISMASTPLLRTPRLMLATSPLAPVIKGTQTSMASRLQLRKPCQVPTAVLATSTLETVLKQTWLHAKTPREVYKRHPVHPLGLADRIASCFAYLRGFVLVTTTATVLGKPLKESHLDV